VELSTIAPDDSPFGDGGAWGLKASRFPQAWNLLETLRRKNTAVDTVVIDHGFQFGHADLTMRPLTLCTTVLHKCTSGGDHDHGNHVAGIIGASYDNAAADGRSRGVSGANPVAHTFGVPVAFDASPTGLIETSVEVWGLVLDAAEQGTIWVASTPNPIIVVEAIGNDDPTGVFPPAWLAPSLSRAGFSKRRV